MKGRSELFTILCVFVLIQVRSITSPQCPGEVTSYKDMSPQSTNKWITYYIMRNMQSPCGQLSVLAVNPINDRSSTGRLPPNLHSQLIPSKLSFGYRKGPV